MNQPADVTLHLSREDATILLLFLKFEHEENFNPNNYNLDALYPAEDGVDTGEVMDNCLHGIMNLLRASLKYRATNVDPQRG